MGRKRGWARRFVMFCIGISLGMFCGSAYNGNWNRAMGWLVASIYAIGWRLEMWNADENRADSAHWRNMWLHSEMNRTSSDGFGKFEPVKENKTEEGE